jgi:oxygen-independent coproporphyrinogen-3 oxidase
LTVEERTALFKWVDDGKLVLPGEELVESQFELLCRVLSDHGIQQYEVSNFATPGFEAIHNGNYWTGESYFGIGPSAHGKIGHTRYWNIANNMSYMNSIREAKLPETTEILTPENQFNEMVMTGLRTRRGVSLSALETLFDLPVNFNKEINSLEAKGVLERKGENIRLSQRDLIKADYYASQLFIL